MKPILSSARTCALLALAVACVFATVDGALARGMNAWDVARLQSVTSVAVSPDGGHLAYTVSVPREPMAEDNGPAYAELHVFDRATGVSIPFVVGQVNVSQVSFSSDGRHIGYVAKRNGDEKAALYVIALAGGESRKILESPEGVSDYAFGPEGQRVAFLAKEAEDEAHTALKDQGFDMEVYEENARPTRLFVVDIDVADPNSEAGEPRLIDFEGHASDLQWAPTEINR